MPRLSRKPPAGATPDRGHPLMRGLVAWYPMLEGGGASAYDYSGYVNRGTLTNMRTDSSWVAGSPKFGGRVPNFDAVDDYIGLPALGLSGGSARTLSAWFFPTNNTGPRAIYSSGTVSNYALWEVVFNEGGVANNIYVVGVNSDVYTAANTIVMNAWNHVVVTMPANSVQNTTNAKVYINGISQSLTGSGLAASNLNTSNSNYAIGSRVASGSQYFGGMIDDLRLYNRVLTHEEIWQLYRQPWTVFYPRRTIFPHIVAPTTFTATMAVTVGGADFSGAATVTQPTYSATAALTTGAATFSGSATHTAPTYTATAALTTGGADFSGTATFAENAFTATAALTTGNAEFTGAATFAPGTKTATSDLTTGGAEFAGSGTVTQPVYAGTAALTGPGAEFAGTGTVTRPTYTGTASLTAPGADFSGAGTFTKPTYSGTLIAEVGGATFTGTGTFAQPVYAGTAALVVGGVDFAGTATVTPPPATYTATANLTTGAVQFTGLGHFIPRVLSICVTDETLTAPHVDGESLTAPKMSDEELVYC